VYILSSLGEYNITHSLSIKLPFAAKLYTVLSALGTILSTPVVPLCWLPTIKSIKKVSTVESSLHVTYAGLQQQYFLGKMVRTAV